MTDRAARVTAIGDRLESAMKSLGLSASAWAAKAGLSRNALNKFLWSVRNSPDSADMSVHSLMMLAESANLSADWLLFGKGESGIVVEGYDSRYPSRAAAIALAVLRGVEREAIEEVVKLDPGLPDPGTDFWWKCIEGEVARIKSTLRKPSPRSSGRVQARNGRK